MKLGQMLHWHEEILDDTDRVYAPIFFGYYAKMRKEGFNDETAVKLTVVFSQIFLEDVMAGEPDYGWDDEGEDK